MKSSQQRFETEVKTTKGAQVRREKESGKRGRKTECLLFCLSHLSESLLICHAAAHISIIHCCLMAYDVVPDQRGQAEHLRMLCSFTVCTFERCMSNRSSKVSARTPSHKGHLHFLSGRSETDKCRNSVIKYSSLFGKVQVQAIF